MSIFVEGDWASVRNEPVARQRRERQAERKVCPSTVLPNAVPDRRRTASADFKGIPSYAYDGSTPHGTRL